MKTYNLKMNLQLFADPSASLQNTTGTMTNEMKTFYEKRLIDQAEPRLVHDQFADYYPVPQNGGKTISNGARAVLWRRNSDGTVRQLDAG